MVSASLNSDNVPDRVQWNTMSPPAPSLLLLHEALTSTTALSKVAGCELEVRLSMGFHQRSAGGDEPIPRACMPPPAELCFS